MNSVLQMDLDKTFGSSPSNVTLPISARPECEGQATKPKLYLYTNFGKMQSPKSANSTSHSLNDVSKSTICRSLGSSGVLNSPYSMTNNTLNISAVTPDPSRLSSQLDNLLSDSEVKSCTPGPDEGLEDTSDPRLCPRVLVDVNLPIQRPKGSNCLTAASAVNNYLSTRTSTPLHSNSGINCERSGKKTRFKEGRWRNAKEETYKSLIWVQIGTFECTLNEIGEFPY
ncbi:hypothetical protein LOTGIDRAFT_153194 [Lottia gigantea]|uniref:Uncharacterized protein n=1 Tax=Lottia gigantea TaxID=225164 RepID=V4AEZ9_LOTGI|nr:hypothetical protein LOTGIDRAFT_153194 [Lottia gigantea]ESO93735.1 hypothetical protein LOTGIDRAFT_153194 [Lottia gigantea]